MSLLLNRFLFATLLLLSLPYFAAAHTTGLSYETTANGHVIDIGYDPASIVAGDRLVLDFTLRDPKTKSSQAFKDVWVRVKLGEEVLVATGVAQASFGPTTMLLQMPKDAQGKLSISMRFENDEDVLAETTFELPIQAQPQFPLLVALLSFLTGVVCMGVLWFFGVVSWSYGRLISFFKL